MKRLDSGRADGSEDLRKRQRDAALAEQLDDAPIVAVEIASAVWDGEGQSWAKGHEGQAGWALISNGLEDADIP